MNIRHLDQKTMTETKTSAGSDRIADRFGKPLDRLWLGGIVTVNALAWAVFGMQYIGLALIAYCFVFVLVLRRRIYVAYPAVANKAYRIRFIGNRLRLFSGKPDKAFLHMLWIFPAYCVAAVALSVTFGSVSMPANGLVFLVCNGVLICQYQSLFTVCCGSGQSAANSAAWERLLVDGGGTALSPLRLTITTVLFAFVWVGVLTAYTTGQIGGAHFFGIAEYGADRLYAAALGLAAPVILHIVLLKLAIVALRGWMINHERHNR